MSRRDDIASTDLRRMSVAEQHDWLHQRRPRRSVLRGGLVGMGAVLGAPALLPGTAGAVAASPTRARPSPAFLRRRDQVAGGSVAPYGRHISYGDDPTTEMNVTWQVGAPVAQPFLRYGTDPAALDTVVPADITTISVPFSDVTSVDSVPLVPPSTDTQYYVKASLGRLQPGQAYFYAVGHAGLDPVAGAAQVSSFDLAPRETGPFRFTAFGDQGVSYDAVATARVVGGQSPAFHLHAGDISYAESGGSGLLTDPFDPRVFDSWFAEVEGVAAGTPWMATVGNHEMEPWYPVHGYGGQLARFAFLGNAPSSCPVSYSFSYGNVGVIALDANDVSYELEANLGYTGGAQTTWLGQTVAALRADPAIDFVVAYFHQCAYCTCSVHASDGGVQQYWAPVFDKYAVDLVIQGHNHIYERTDPIVHGEPTGEAPIGSTIWPAEQGTTYVTAGSSGKSLYGFPTGVPDSYIGNVDDVSTVSTFVWEPGTSPANPVAQPVSVTWSRVRYTGYALVVVDSSPASRAGGTSTLTVRSLMEDGATALDEFTLARTH